MLDYLKKMHRLFGDGLRLLLLMDSTALMALAMLLFLIGLHFLKLIIHYSFCVHALFVLNIIRNR